MRVHVIEKRLERAGAEFGIGVEQKKITPLRHRKGLVVAARESKVLRICDHAHAREFRAQHLDRAVGGGVVHDDDLSFQ